MGASWWLASHRAIAPNPLDADAQRLKVGAAEDDPPVSGEVQGLLLSVLRVFFREVRNVAPGLGEVLAIDLRRSRQRATFSWGHNETGMSYSIVRQAIIERTSLTAHYDDYIR